MEDPENGFSPSYPFVIPAQAGIQRTPFPLNPGFRRGDEWGESSSMSFPNGKDA